MPFDGDSRRSQAFVRLTESQDETDGCILQTRKRISARGVGDQGLPVRSLNPRFWVTSSRSDTLTPKARFADARGGVVRSCGDRADGSVAYD